MADVLDDPAFWLPQEILTDDEELFDFGGGRKHSAFFTDDDSDGGSKPAAAVLSAYAGFGSVGVSSESESDEEDLAGLTRRLARSNLDDGYGSKYNSRGWGSSGSPQSTLCALESGSSRGSPNAQSPPATWDLLHAAAGEVAKMRMKEEEALRFKQQQSRARGILGAPIEASSPVAVSDFGYHKFAQQHQSLSHTQFQAAQFHRLRQQQILKEQISAAFAGAHAHTTGRFPMHPTQTQTQSRPMGQTRPGINSNGPLGLSSSAWPPLQQAQQQRSQPTGAGFGGVLMTPKKESTGTGVFLPRQIENAHPQRKKQQKQVPVFVPAKVVQALKLNEEEFCAQPQPGIYNRFTARNTPDYELAMRIQNNQMAMALQQNRNVNIMRQQQGAVNHEIKLPQEWTY